MSQDTLNEIEQNIKAARAQIQLGDALERLTNNKDFKTLVLDGYFRDEAVRLVHLKADPAFQKPDMQTSIVSQMDAIGSLSSYLRVIGQSADMGRRSVEVGEQTREEILREDMS